MKTTVRQTHIYAVQSGLSTSPLALGGFQSTLWSRADLTQLTGSQDISSGELRYIERGNTAKVEMERQSLEGEVTERRRGQRKGEKM